jgi:glutaminase
MAENMQRLLEAIHRAHRSCDEGAVAESLPELARVDPDLYGICVMTVDGVGHAVGDSSVPFTVQSIAKPFVYGLALEDLGLALVRRCIGVEPTGDPFDSVLPHDDVAARRFNPMVNAGAIATTSLIQGRTRGQRWQRIRAALGRYMCKQVTVDDAVLASKRQTDHVSRGLAYLMCSEGMIEGEIEDVIELYFRQCAIQTDCHDLALMAATLANAGRNPVSGEQAISRRYVKHMLSVMFSSGLYDFSGQWAYRVGLPAKSAISGALIAVVPGRFGLAVYSPRLGTHSKSVRGVRTCEDISRMLELHLFATERTRGASP